MRRPIPRKSLYAHALPPDTAGDVYASVNARLLVTLYFQEAVNQERAEWWTNDDGQTELHVKSGEVFLLLEPLLPD